MAVSVYKDEYIIRVYQLAQQGLTEKKISKVLSISVATFHTWEKKKKIFKMALEMGRKEWGGGKSENETTIQDYIFKSLPKNLRKLWNEINALEKAKSGVEKIEALLEKRGVRARQSICLHAIVKGNFSISRALRKVNISRCTFNAWCAKDHEFAQLVSDIEWYKGNFYEDQYIAGIAGGDSNLIRHAQETFNKKRGYGKNIEVGLNVEGNLHISHSIDDLDVPLPVIIALLKAVRKKKNGDEKTKTKTDPT